MSFQDISAEQLAMFLHHYHEALAPDFRMRTQADAGVVAGSAVAREEPDGRGSVLNALGAGLHARRVRERQPVFRTSWRSRMGLLSL